ncbi:DEAD/DEAH box helicase family protein [bacterium]|nr:DEAD/DEAH box helicase family protein [bacterium]
MARENNPTIFHFPSFDRFIILDLETTGLDKSARPFQFSALKVENWRITDFINLYANIPPEELKNLPYTLQLKLQLTEPELRKRIEEAPPIEEVLKSFASFLSDFPLIGHNIGFDLSILASHDLNLPNPYLDSLELVSLAFPLASSYSLEEIIKEVGIEDEIAKLSDELRLEGLFPHNALYDCLALYCLLKKSLEKLKESKFLSLLHLISPVLAESLSLPSPPNDFSHLFPPHNEAESLEEIMREPSEFSFTSQEVLQFYDELVEKGRWEKRKSQRTVIGKVAELFEKGKIGMIEAPTGTGKTLAYLLPASFLVSRGGGKVIIATYTKHLQNQAVSDLENKLLPFLPFSPRYVVLKGRGNYLCMRRFLYKLEDAFLRFSEETTEEEKFLLLYVGRFIEEAKDKIEDLDAFPYWLSLHFPYTIALKEDIKSDRDICVRNSCPFFSLCFFQRADRASKEADVIITNHWLLLMKKWHNPQECSIVVDEAHNLEDAASKAFGKEIGKVELTALLSLFLNKEGNRGMLLRVRKILGDNEDLRSAFAAVRELHELLDELGKALHFFFLTQNLSLHNYYAASLWMKRLSRRDERHWRKVRELIRKMSKTSEQLRFAIVQLVLKLSSQSPHLADELRNIYNNFSKRLNDCFSLSNWDYNKKQFVRWIELEISEDAPEEIDLNSPPPQFLNWLFREAPLRVDEALRENIYEKFRSVVFTSATLTIAGKGFSFFLDRLGLDDYISDDDLLSLPPAFNYNENVLLLLPYYLRSDASQKNIEKFKEETLEELFHFISFVEGRSLVLFSARERLEYVGKNLEPRLGERMLPLYWQRRGVSKRHLLREFRDREEATLLGLRSFWEGVDVPGPSLSYLILEKLPFPSVRDPLSQARREQMRKMGRDEYIDYLLPMTIIPFKQGFGRLIRSPNDRGVVLFLDKRLRSDILSREIALASLPGFKRDEECEKTRKSLYSAVSEHMKLQFPSFPWKEKLEQVEEFAFEEKPSEEFPLNGEILLQKDCVLLTTNLSPILSHLTRKNLRVAIISYSDPAFLLSQHEQPIPYLPPQPVLNMSLFLRIWEETPSVLSLHPYWLMDEEVREKIKKADILIITQPLSLLYSSTFFSPVLSENIPEVKRKIFLFHPSLEEFLSNFNHLEFIKTDKENFQLLIRRISDIYPFLTEAKKQERDVIIYTPKGKELEEELNKRNFFASWGEEMLPLFQKDLLNILILPPGRTADKQGAKIVIHYPPIGDKISYLVESSQAQWGGGEGYALVCLKNGIPLEEQIQLMFPDERDIEDFSALLNAKREVLFLNPGQIPPKRWRLIHLFSQSGRASWRIVERMVGIVLQEGKEVEDKELREILRENGVSSKRIKTLDLLASARKSGIPLDVISHSLHRALLRGELFYEVKSRAILVRAKNSHAKVIPPISREEIIREWSELSEFVSSIPSISEVDL